MLLRDGWEYTEGFMNVTKFMEDIIKNGKFVLRDQLAIL